MGGVDSKLVDISKEQVAQHVVSLGSDYEAYAPLIDDNGIDGDLLSEMDGNMFLETLDDVEITDPKHRATLLQEFKVYTATLQTPAVVGGPVGEVQMCDHLSIGNSSRLSMGMSMGMSIGGASLHNSSSSNDSQEEQNHKPQSTFPQTNHNHNNTQVDTYVSTTGSYDYEDIDGTRPPFAEDDAPRVANLESYKLEEIEPDSEIATKLQGLVQMALNLYDMDMGDISFLNHEYQYSTARVGMTGPMDAAVATQHLYQAVNHSANGKPFLCKSNKTLGIGSYPYFSKTTFVVHDIMDDDAFRWLRAEWPFRFYAAAPLLSASGYAIGTLCMHNLEPMPDFDQDCELQLEQVASMIVQSIENWKLQRNITTLESTRKTLQSGKNKSEPPQNKAVVVFTGIEDYDSLIDENPEIMEEAIMLCNGLLEQLRDQYFGYQVATIGDDGHFLVFHDAVDAFGFSLEFQHELHELDWPDELFELSAACDNGSGFRGLRVKIGAHMGPVTVSKDPSTGRPTYKSPKHNTVAIAKSLYELSYGGQTLTSFDTWNQASFMAETKLAAPQVIDLGTHALRNDNTAKDGVLSHRIVQLVPESLAVNYSELGNPDKDTDNMDFSVEDFHASSEMWGRHFPDIKSLKKLSPSFFDAPGLFDSGLTKITIAFIGTSAVEKRYEEAPSIVANIISLASSALLGTPGYQCQNNMLAFPNITSAVVFGLNFSELLQKQKPLDDRVSLASLVTFGCVHDTFITLEPHKTTGRADYFGKVVNRAARVAYSSEPSTVCAGVVVTPEFKQNEFTVEDPNVSFIFQGLRKLKGVEGEMAIYECRKENNVVWNRK